jgi:hypothetical protein
MAVPADPTSDFAAPHGSRVVMTTGLHGSASTWVFNVARELMIATFGAEAVLSFFAETPTSLLAYPGVSGRHIVCKTHRRADLPTSASEGAAAVIVTVRDPRDCVFSLMGRFGSGFAVSVRAIANVNTRWPALTPEIRSCATRTASSTIQRRCACWRATSTSR